MPDISFAYPFVLWLLVLLIPMIIWYIYKHNQIHANIKISTIRNVSKRKGFRYYLRYFLFILRLAAFTFIILALARPQTTLRWENTSTEGIDIMLSMDISWSMLARDFSPNRLEASKTVASQFVLNRHHDRIGLVVFSGESFTQCPLTTDQTVMLNLLKEIKNNDVLEQGTAIGMGLATAVSRLKDSKTKSKIIILLTDGENNRGDIAPKTAAELAKAFDIKVYTIGVGTKGTAPTPVGISNGRMVYQNMPVKIDEKLLKEIAKKTGGSYFRATNKKALERIYNQIDKLEKTKIDVKQFSKKNEMYMVFAAIAGVLISIFLLLKYTLLKKIP